MEDNLARAGAAPAPVVAMVSVSGPTDGRWQASLLFQVGYTRAERQFEAESCEAIASAAALVIALWAEGGPDVPPPPAPAPAPEKPPIAPVVEPGPPQFVLMLNGVLDWGTMPDPPGGGMEAAGGPIWTFPDWRLRALGGLSFFPNRRTPLMDTAVEQANFRLFDFSGRGCATVVSDRFEIGPCAGVELAIMQGSGTDLSGRARSSGSRSSARPWPHGAFLRRSPSSGEPRSSYRPRRTDVPATPAEMPFTRSRPSLSAARWGSSCAFRPGSRAS